MIPKCFIHGTLKFKNVASALNTPESGADLSECSLTEPVLLIVQALNRIRLQVMIRTWTGKKPASCVKGNSACDVC